VGKEGKGGEKIALAILLPVALERGKEFLSHLLGRGKRERRG